MLRPGGRGVTAALGDPLLAVSGHQLGDRAEHRMGSGGDSVRIASSDAGPRCSRRQARTDLATWVTFSIDSSSSS